MGSTRNSECRQPGENLCPAEKWEVPYSEWAKNQKEWLEALHYPPSSRGRKRQTVYDSLYYEREMARLSDHHSAPSYAQSASGLKLEAKASLNFQPDAKTGRLVSENGRSLEDYRKQKFIRSYQRRKNALRLPDPSQN